MRAALIYKLAIITTLLMSSLSSINAEVFKGYPDILACEAGQGADSPGELLFYLESRSKDGTVFYRSTYRMLTIKIDKDGIVREDTPSINDCLNKSLEELRKQGRTFKFTK